MQASKRVGWQGNCSMTDDLNRVVVWKSLLLVGTEYCALSHSAEGWLLKGTVVGILKDHACADRLGLSSTKE
jgi:hypothetical protein